MAKTKDVWRERLARLAKSNLEFDEFATREGVKPASLKWWRWRLGLETERSRARAPVPTPPLPKRSTAPVAMPAFVEVVAPSPSNPSPATPTNVFEVMLTNGRVVRVPPGFSGDELARVLAVVEGT